MVAVKKNLAQYDWLCRRWQYMTLMIVPDLTVSLISCGGLM